MKLETNLTAFCELHPKQWEEIHQTLDGFLSKDANLTQSPLIRNVVADSWIRSKQNASSNESIKKLKPTQFQKILADNRQLMEIAVPILKESFSFLSPDIPYSFALVDRSGCMLLTFNSPNDESKLTISCPGTDLSEEAVGTSSHALCINLDSPTYLISPENYHKILRAAQVAISLPIHNTKEQVIATLSMTCYNDLSQIYQNKNFFRWLISLQTSLLRRIETEMQLSSRKYSVRTGRDLFDTAMSLVDRGIISINPQGKITYINDESENFFNLPASKLNGMNYSDVLGTIPEIDSLLQNASKDSSQDNSNGNIHYFHNNQQYRIKARTVYNGTTQTSEGVVMCITPQTLQHNNNVSNRSFDTIFGNSPEMARAKKIAEKFAANPHSILLCGESGTGKELFAQAIHNEFRPEGPFIAVNCSAIPKNLIESELFGYEGGSFTGAEKKGRPGKLELASGGTLFLDEIGDMPLEIQPVLLRALEDRQIMRIGGSKYIPVDFRIVAATNKNLLEAIKNKEFREDLYFRLSVFKITIPSLRSRESDIIDLAQYFIGYECARLGIPVPKVEDSVLTFLRNYDWPGNVRQLKNAMCYAVNIAEKGIIKLGDLPEEMLDNSLPNTLSPPKPLLTLEKEAIEKAMLFTGNNIRLASAFLGLSRSTLYRKLKEHGINDQAEM